MVKQKFIEKWKPHRLLVSDEKGTPLGIVQILVKELSVFGYVARLNRGPLLIGDENNKNHIIKILIINVICRYAFKKMVDNFFAPEIESSDISNNELKLLPGILFKNKPKWASGRINLKKNEADLLKQFKGKEKLIKERSKIWCMC